MENNLKLKILKTIIASLGGNETDISLDRVASLDDLGISMNSILFLDMVMNLENEFDIELDVSEIALAGKDIAKWIAIIDTKLEDKK